MRIQLKQHEIEDAITKFLSNQGIDTSGKTIVMGFTAGRKKKGISVEVVIEDTATTSNSEVTTVLVEEVAASEADPEPAYESTPADDTAPEEGAVQVVTPVTTAASLFG